MNSSVLSTTANSITYTYPKLWYPITNSEPTVDFTVAEINYLMRLAKKDQKLAKLLDRLMDAANVEVVFQFTKEQAEED